MGPLSITIYLLTSNNFISCTIIIACVLPSQYYRLPHVIIGGYDNVRDDSGEPVPLQFRLRQYREAELNISESRFILDGHVDELYCKMSVLWLT